MRCWRGVAGNTIPARRGRRVYVAWAVGLLMATGGCLRPAPPKLDLAKPSPPPARLNLEPYLRATRYGEWVYGRVELGRNVDQPPMRYARRTTARRLSEGWLELRELPPLERYMRERHGPAPTGEPAEEPPPPLSPEEAPQLFELETPMAPIPAELAEANLVIDTTAVRYYDRRGRLETTGSLTRRAELEGVQDVDCPAGRFTECLRVRVELHIEFPLGPIIDWNSFVWLSREAGEVRRIEEFSGWFWIFGFGSAHEYWLVSYPRTAPQSAPVSPPPLWQRGLILLDRPIPRPRTSGVMIDFAPPASETDELNDE